MSELTAAERAAIEADLRQIALQECALVFAKFDEDAAWSLGCALRETAVSGALPVAIDIRLHERVLFICALPGATADNGNWARRKANLVHRKERASYAIGLDLALRGRVLDADSGLDLRDFAAHGGGFPIRVSGVGLIGAVTVSGLPQREDHNLVVAALAAALGKDVSALALAAR